MNVPLIKGSEISNVPRTRGSSAKVSRTPCKTPDLIRYGIRVGSSGAEENPLVGRPRIQPSSGFRDCHLEHLECRSANDLCFPSAEGSLRSEEKPLLIVRLSPRPSCHIAIDDATGLVTRSLVVSVIILRGSVSTSGVTA
jgi:hypothetical protein